MNESFNLTLSPELFSSWDWENALSEIVQNGIDEARQSKNKFTVNHNGETLTISNEYASLEKDSLISGYSTKRGVSGMIGKFGIGLPAALSTFARLGFNVEIYTNTQIWKPNIVRDPNFNNAEVTRISVRQRRANRKLDFNGVSIYISPVTYDMWETAKKRFLFLQEDKYKKIETSYGEILLDPEESGRIYNKGIFVQKVREFEYGYNMYHLEIDMERKVVDHYILQENSSQMLGEALISKTNLFLDNIWNKLVSGSREVYYLIGCGKNSHEIQRILVNKFNQDNPNKIPVESMQEALEIEHYGKQGVVIFGGDLRNMLQEVIGSLAELKTEFKNSWSKTYSFSELTQLEIDNISQAINLVTRSITKSLNPIQIVDFNCKDIYGLFKQNQIFISRKCLSNLTDSNYGVLGVLIHEYAHNFGPDGSVSHVRAIENLWNNVVKTLLQERA